MKIYQETLTEKAVTMKARANGSLKHLLARSVDTPDVLGNKSNQIFCQQILNINYQGIEIAIIELTGPSDCSTDYLEVTVI